MTKSYQVKYHTHNTYEANVTEALFELLVAPCQDGTQAVRDLKYHNSFGQAVFQHNNPFGFSLACVRSVKPFKDFEFTMTATVDKKLQDNPYLGMLSVEEEQAKLTSIEFYIDHHLYLNFNKYTTIGDDFNSKLLNRQQDQPVYEYLQQLNQHIHAMLEFDAEPTHVHTTANEVLALGRGVCQDYTHLFLAMARKNRIPCRYVSGYLNQGGTLVGSAVMHAWIEAYVPGIGWQGFDPTNNLLADQNHIKAAHGSDYSDCSPIKGVLKTSGGHKTTYGVKVILQETEAEEQAQQEQVQQ